MNKKTRRSEYMYTGKREAQVLNLQNCPPGYIQKAHTGATYGITKMPSIHDCIEAQVWYLA